GVLSRLREAGDISGKANELTPLLDRSGLAARRLLAVGLGKRKQAERIGLIDAAAAAARFVTDKKRARIAFALPENVPALGWDEVAHLIGVGLFQGCQGPGLRQSEPSRFMPEEIALVAPPS